MRILRLCAIWSTVNVNVTKVAPQSDAARPRRDGSSTMLAMQAICTESSIKISTALRTQCRHFTASICQQRMAGLGYAICHLVDHCKFFILDVSRLVRSWQHGKGRHAAAVACNHYLPTSDSARTVPRHHLPNVSHGPKHNTAFGSIRRGKI